MEYSHERAVADNVNAGYEVYRMQTEITERGSRVEAGFYIDRRHKLTGKTRWELLDEELEYAPSQLDQYVVTPDQIRTIIRTFKEKHFDAMSAWSSSCVQSISGGILPVL